MSKSTLMLLGFLGLVLAVFVWRAAGPDAQVTDHSMTQPDLTEVREGAPIASVQIPENLSANAQIGKRAFDAKCAACHGTNAAGQNGVAPPLVHKIYEPNHHADMAFVLAAQNGVRAHHWEFGNMPPVEGLTRGDVLMIAEYVRELQKANGID